VPASPPHQPVYASVVKKKKKPSSPPTRVKLTNQQQQQQQQQQTSQTMTDAPRSPARIPLIRISQTESVERADKNPPTTSDPSVEHHQVYICFFFKLLSSGIFIIRFILARLVINELMNI
jgi:hypothetical protein